MYIVNERRFVVVFSDMAAKPFKLLGGLIANELLIGIPESHKLMFGMLVSAATVSNRDPMHTSAPSRHVAGFDALVSLLRASSTCGAIGMVHIELEKDWSGSKETTEEVCRLLDALGAEGVLPAVQLNGSILPETLSAIETRFGLPVVLQFRTELSEKTEKQVVSYLKEIKGLVSRVLIDPSAGTGSGIDLEDASRWCPVIEQVLQDSSSFGFAGGLGGDRSQDTAAVVAKIKEIFGSSDFSIDVESRVREPANDQKISLTRYKKYLEGAITGLVD